MMDQNIPWFLMNQGAAVPPDQAQIQQTNMEAPPMLRAPAGDPPQAPAAAPAPMAAQPHMASAPQKSALDAYVGHPPPKDPLYWMEQAQGQAKRDQNAELSGISDYINKLQNKPREFNWTPLAALADSMVPGSKLTAAAQSMAPETDDQRDKQIGDLKMKLLGGRAAISREDLASLRQQQQQLQFQQHQQELERHNQQMEQNNATGGQNQRGLAAIDSRLQAAGSLFDSNKTLQSAIDRKNQIALDTHTLSNPSTILDTKVMDEISGGIANALQGGRGAGLEQVRMQQIQSADRDFAKLRSYIENKPVGALSPENKAQLQNILGRLDQGYGNIVAATAKRIHAGRTSNIPEVQKVLDNKLADYMGYGDGDNTSGFGPSAANAHASGTMNGVASSAKVRVSNGSKTLMIDPADLVHAQADGFKEVR